MIHEVNLHIPLAAVGIFDQGDGRRRWLACEKAGVKPEIIVVSPEDPIAHVRSLNLHRRHLTVSQGSMCAQRARDKYDEAAKNRQGKRTDLKKDLQDNCPEGSGQARDKVGEVFGVSGGNHKSAQRARDKYDEAARKRMVAGKKTDPVTNCSQGHAGKARDQVGEVFGVSGGNHKSAQRARDKYDEAAKERQKLSEGRGKKGPDNCPDLKGQARDQVGEVFGVSQASMCAHRAREKYDKVAKERQKAAGGDRKSNGAKSLPVNCTEAIGKGDARDQVGEAFGVSGGSVDRAARLVKHGIPELGKALGSSGEDKAMFRGSLMGVPRSQSSGGFPDAPIHRPRHCLKRSFPDSGRPPRRLRALAAIGRGPAARPGWPPERQPAVRHADHFRRRRRGLLLAPPQKKIETLSN
jgi:hypothetical protein